ncbi:MAG: hypothetical protein V1913_10860 [Fibrobacterota bacterium]
MKKLILLLLLLTFVLPVQARRGGNFGLGIILGAPTGFAFKKWTNSQNAVSGAIAFGSGASAHSNYYWSDPDLYLQASYLWHNFNAIPLDGGAAMPLYAGVGGRVIVGDPFQMGVRVCGGVSIIPASMPLDFFLEFGVTVDVFEEPGAMPDAGLGARFYF